MGSDSLKLKPHLLAITSHCKDGIEIMSLLYSAHDLRARVTPLTSSNDTRPCSGIVALCMSHGLTVLLQARPKQLQCRSPSMSPYML